MEMRPSELPAHTEEIAAAMNEALTQKWAETRGISVVSVAVGTVTLPDEDAQMIKDAQKSAILRDPNMAAAQLAGAQADAMRAAASNSAGAMTGFMGMGMAQQAGGMNAQQLFAMGQQQQAAQAAQAPAAQPAQPAAGAVNGWTCSCGAVNKGKFCSECGSPKPAGALLYKCDKCGWEPEDPAHPPKFCPECGDPFDDNDAVK